MTVSSVPADGLPQPRLSPPPLVIPDGTLELLKWVALALMTVDHVNKYLLDAGQPWMFDLGRLVMPIFTAVLAYNLARPQARERGLYQRTLGRLLYFGTITTPIFLAIGATYRDTLWPLNILFLLASIVGCIWLIEIGGVRGWAGAAVVFLVGGMAAEYFWPGALFGIAVWFYARRPSWTAAVFALLGCGGLYFVNGVWWSLAALPVLLLMPRVRLRLPRLRLAFYIYYPLHLAVIWLVQRAIAHW